MFDILLRTENIWHVFDGKGKNCLQKQIQNTQQNVVDENTYESFVCVAVFAMHIELF